MDHEIKKIAIVGKGNVGSHLALALQSIAEVTLVDSRTLDNLPNKSDLLIIAVKDDAIQSVASRVRGKAQILVHTSGSMALSVLDGFAPETGVFYPMQTFTKGVNLNYQEIPFFIEGSSEETEGKLINLASSISENVNRADSEIRKKLHVAAVFSCNFTNHLLFLADDLLHKDGLDYKVMLPLLRQTVAKLSSVAPEKAQTGPAARGDTAVISSHLELLSEDPGKAEIYKILSSSILDTYNH